jgi:K+-transporting ATPase ATPase A chain
MTANGWLQLLIYLVILVAVTPPLGTFMTRIFSGEKTWLTPVLRPLERLIYRCCRIDENAEQHWTEYGIAMLVFSGVSMLVLYGIERLQAFLPSNPQHFSGVAPALAFNTAASFTTNTNWQNYSGESAMSYLTQMAGLAFHNFASAATGIALAIAFIRGVARRESRTIGNFWVDLTRCCLYLLLPISLAGSLVLVWQGVPQNLERYTHAALLEPQRVESKDAAGKVKVETHAEQVIAQGPVASQEIIKELGTNGGGFFGANSAHPFEDPTPLANFIEMLAILAIASGLTYTLGRMTGSQKHGWAVFAAMLALLLAGFFTVYHYEAAGNPTFARYGISQAAAGAPPGGEQAGGNMEGKEVRFGIFQSALFATVTTDASCGAVNAQHDSFTPLGGMIPMLNIMLGEVVFGGVGSGLYGMLVMIVLTVFIAGLMVGRTPEYLGKKIESKDVKMAMLYALIFAFNILVLAAWASVTPYGTAALNNSGPHGLSEIVYAFTSVTGNNGSAFGGLSANTSWYNWTLGIAMLVGRFLMIVPMLAIAGNLATKKAVPPSAGTFPVHTPLFVALLLGVILIVSALTFFPVLSLAPIVEHLLMQAGTMFS